MQTLSMVKRTHVIPSEIHFSLRIENPSRLMKWKCGALIVVGLHHLAELADGAMMHDSIGWDLIIGESINTCTRRDTNAVQIIQGKSLYC